MANTNTVDSYVEPTSGGESPFAKAGAFKTDPLQYDYKKELEIGESIEFRIFGIKPPHVLSSPARKATITNPNTGGPMNIPVYEPSHDVLTTIKDDAGKLLSSCEQTTIYRMAIWLLAKNSDPDRKGICRNREELKELRYIEFTPGIAISINKLRTYQGGLGAFDKETDRPYYDVRLTVVAGTSSTFSKNYELEPIMNIGMDPDTKRPITSPVFGVKTEEALGAHMKTVKAEWGTLMKAMNNIPGDDDIKRKFGGKSPKASAASALGDTRSYEDRSEDTGAKTYEFPE